MMHRWFWGLLAVFFLAIGGCSTAGSGRSAPAGAVPAPSMPETPPAPGALTGAPPSNAPAVSKADPSPTAKPPGVQVLEADEECLIDDDELDTNALPPQGKEPTLNRALVFCRAAQAH